MTAGYPRRVSGFDSRRGTPGWVGKARGLLGDEAAGVGTTQWPTKTQWPTSKRG